MNNTTDGSLEAECHVMLCLWAVKHCQIEPLPERAHIRDYVPYLEAEGILIARLKA